MRKPNPKLVTLYAEIAAHTKPECDGVNHGCRVPRSCCSMVYCEAAKRFALDEYGIELKFFDPDTSIPFLSPSGCIVPPHLRPVCSIHACCINSIGAKTKGKGSVEWTKRYFELRYAIEDLEEKSLDDMVSDV